ncbi:MULTISPECIES: thioredoxinprotein [Fusobacterium]|jgi:thiredoxinprotein|uniref:thioredoxinprotein n=1 Tax=Fusobacterium TaxID=848 RepID=UPI002A814C57|nr:thioredoxinprotein [Fusobacterium sp.]
MKKTLLIIFGIFFLNACMTNDYYYISPTGEKRKIPKSNPSVKIQENKVINRVSIYQ